MKKAYTFYGLICLLLMLCSSAAHAQLVVPNGDFESWDFNGWNFSPTAWMTGNTQVTENTFRDTIAYEGEFAMRVEGIPVELGVEGEASIQIPTGAIPPSLDFYTRYQRTFTAALNVRIDFYNNSEEAFYTEIWQAPDTAADWTFVSIPLNQIEPVMTHAIIRVQVLVGDFAPGQGWIAVDAMSFGEPNALVERETMSFSLYPVPALDEISIRLNADNSPQRVIITDVTGQIIIDTPYTQRIPINGLTRGRYTLMLIDSNGERSTKAFTVLGQ